MIVELQWKGREKKWSYLFRQLKVIIVASNFVLENWQDIHRYVDYYAHDELRASDVLSNINM